MRICLEWHVSRHYDATCWLVHIGHWISWHHCRQHWHDCSHWHARRQCNRRHVQSGRGGRKSRAANGAILALVCMALHCSVRCSRAFVAAQKAVGKTEWFTSLLTYVSYRCMLGVKHALVEELLRKGIITQSGRTCNLRASNLGFSLWRFGSISQKACMHLGHPTSLRLGTLEAAMVGLQIFARPRGLPQPRGADAESDDKPSTSTTFRRNPRPTEVLVRVPQGKWTGDHRAVILQKGRPAQNRKALTASEELQQLQGAWDLNEVTKKGKQKRDDGKCCVAKVYVRGKRVEESLADGRRQFFNLVLAERAAETFQSDSPQRTSCAKRKLPLHDDDRKSKRHALPPLDGPQTLQSEGQKGPKGKGKTVRQSRKHSAGHWVLLHHTPKLLILRDGISIEEPHWWHPEEQLSWGRCGHMEECMTVKYLHDEHIEKLCKHAKDPSGTWRTTKGVEVIVSAAK